MNKILRIFSVLIIMFGVLFMLCGCGDESDSKSSSKKNNANSSENTTTTVKVDPTVSGDNMLTGSMEEYGEKSTIKMSFDKNDKLEKIGFIYEFKNEEDAEELYNSSKDEIKGTGIQVLKQGNTVTIVYTADDFSSKYGLSKDKLDKETMKQFATYMGYKLDV